MRVPRPSQAAARAAIGASARTSARPFHPLDHFSFTNARLRSTARCQAASGEFRSSKDMSLEMHGDVATKYATAAGTASALPRQNSHTT